MSTSREARLVQTLLAEVGVALNGSNPWDIRINDERMFARVLSEKNLGLGESYMDGWWDCDRIDDLICRILRGNLKEKLWGNFRLLIPYVLARLSNRQSRKRAYEVAQTHYDLDNQLFMSFLDPYNQYSCAYFETGKEDLTQAQRKKMQLVCRKLELTADDHLLDIGFGWGGLARYAAENYGCAVTGVNISREQIAFAKEFCKGLPVRILEKDYREIEGQYSKIVSVGMFEHVGYKNYRVFMESAYKSLNADGIFLLHTIGSNDSGVNTDPWINKYIFPNGMLPSLAQITKAAEGLFVIEDLHNLGPHYDKTLMAWHRNFQNSRDLFKQKYSERFVRMWEYYLLSCAGAFRARYNQLWQIVMTKPGRRQPLGIRSSVDSQPPHGEARDRE